MRTFTLICTPEAFCTFFARNRTNCHTARRTAAHRLETHKYTSECKHRHWLHKQIFFCLYFAMLVVRLLSKEDTACCMVARHISRFEVMIDHWCLLMLQVQRDFPRMSLNLFSAPNFICARGEFSIQPTSILLPRSQSQGGG